MGCCWRTIVDQNHEPKDGLFCNVIVRDPIKKTTWIYDSNGIYSEGTAGPKGDKGEKGDKGDTGPQGEQGIQGIQGERGPQGIQGPEGPQGAKGDTGAPGPQGPQGEPGAKGDTGDRGPQGPAGQDGAQGPAGQDGAAATIAVGTTTTGAAGTQASVTNSGSASAAVFNFTIPKGEKGDKGDTGPAGADGARGPQGEQGPKGEKGDTGPAGTTTFAGLTGSPTDNASLASALNAKADTSDVHNATITINAYGTAAGSFTVNQSAARTINIPEPTVNLVVEEI